MSDFLMVSGGVLVAIGAAWVYPPSGVIVAGLLFIAFGVLKGLADGSNTEIS